MKLYIVQLLRIIKWSLGMNETSWERVALFDDEMGKE